MERIRKFIDSLDPNNNMWHRTFVVMFSIFVPLAAFAVILIGVALAIEHRMESLVSGLVSP